MRNIGSSERARSLFSHSLSLSLCFWFKKKSLIICGTRARAADTASTRVDGARDGHAGMHGTGALDAGLTAAWDFEDFTATDLGTAYQDSSGNGYHASQAADKGKGLGSTLATASTAQRSSPTGT